MLLPAAVLFGPDLPVCGVLHALLPWPRLSQREEVASIATHTIQHEKGPGLPLHSCTQLLVIMKDEVLFFTHSFMPIMVVATVSMAGEFVKHVGILPCPFVVCTLQMCDRTSTASPQPPLSSASTVTLLQPADAQPLHPLLLSSPNTPSSCFAG